jgi:hypothetical protein
MRQLCRPRADLVLSRRVHRDCVRQLVEVSIVSEVASWGQVHLQAAGLGACNSSTVVKRREP